MNRTCRMLAATLTVAAASFTLQGTALAGVTVGVNVGVPSFYYGAGYYPPGPCDAYSYYYEGDCGYPVYSGRVFVNGVWVTGPHYYRWYNGRPLFWHRGGWHAWNGWRGARWNWNRAPGWGWHHGRWSRAWGRSNWHGNVHVREGWHGGGKWQGHTRETVRVREDARGRTHVRETVRTNDGRHHH